MDARSIEHRETCLRAVAEHRLLSPTGCDPAPLPAYAVDCDIAGSLEGDAAFKAKKTANPKPMANRKVMITNKDSFNEGLTWGVEDESGLAKLWLFMILPASTAETFAGWHVTCKKLKLIN